MTLTGRRAVSLYAGPPDDGDARPEILTLAQAKAHLRITHTAEDTLISDLIRDAEEHIEGRTGQRLLTGTFDLHDGKLWDYPIVTLPYPPMQSVVSVTVVSETGVETVISASLYTAVIDTWPGRIRFADSSPIAVTDLAALRIRYKAGYGDTAAAIPREFLRQARHIVAYWYFERLGGTPSITVQSIEHIDKQLGPHRVETL